MKKISIVHAVLFLLLVTKMSYSYVSVEKIIKNIRKEYTEINSKKKFYTAKKLIFTRNLLREQK
jgi:CHASE3 domain sensor protein